MKGVEGYELAFAVIHAGIEVTRYGVAATTSGCDGGLRGKVD